MGENVWDEKEGADTSRFFFGSSFLLKSFCVWRRRDSALILLASRAHKEGAGEATVQRQVSYSGVERRPRRKHFGQ